MNERSTHHATFTIRRHYPASPARVFAAWADPVAKAEWFACHDDWQPSRFELDCREGGGEHLRTGPVEGTVHAYDATYFDVVPNERLVFAYEMHLDDTRISVSLATVEFKRDGGGTLLVFTEQGAFLDGYADVEGREEGTRVGLDNLAKVLERETVTA